MKKNRFPRFGKYMIRPLIYQTVTRVLLALLAPELYARFVSDANVSSACVVMMLVFLVLAWMSYLRLDGFRAPEFDRKMFRRQKHRTKFVSFDMADHLDDDLVTYDELETDEKDLCLLCSNGIAAAASVVFSFLL